MDIIPEARKKEYVEVRFPSELYKGGMYLTPKARLVFAMLHSWMHRETRECFPKRESIMERTGLCLDAVRLALKELRDFRWITSKQAGRSSNRYMLIEKCVDEEGRPTIRPTKEEAEAYRQTHKRRRQALKRQPSLAGIPATGVGPEHVGENTSLAGIPTASLAGYPATNSTRVTVQGKDPCSKKNSSVGEGRPQLEKLSSEEFLSNSEKELPPARNEFTARQLRKAIGNDNDECPDGPAFEELLGLISSGRIPLKFIAYCTAWMRKDLGYVWIVPENILRWWPKCPPGRRVA